MKSILHLRWLAGKGSKIFHEDVASFFFLLGFCFLVCFCSAFFGVEGGSGGKHSAVCLFC